MTTTRTASETTESADTVDDVDIIETAESEADQDDTSTETDATDQKGRGTRRATPVIAFLAVLVLVAGGIATYFGVQVADDTEVRTAQSQASDAARSFALTMASYDAAGMDTYVRKVMTGSTGELRDTFSRTSNGLKDTLAKAGVKSTGRVLDVATKSSTSSRVELVAVVQQSASNATVTTPQEAVNVLQMTMEKIDGRWLASSVKNPSGTAP